MLLNMLCSKSDQYDKLKQCALFQQLTNAFLHRPVRTPVLSA